MKLYHCLILATSLTFVHSLRDAPARISNRNSTIWAESAVAAMRASSQAIYKTTLDLYNKRTIFDNGAAANCSSPADDGTETVCTRADQIVANSSSVISDAWNSLAKAMFPVSFGLPDNKNEKRADFSDFSHFYNYLFLEMQIWQNITHYYVCSGQFLGQSKTNEALDSIFFNNQDVATIRYGPLTHDCPQPESYECRAANGTDTQYGRDSGSFVKSWAYRWDGMSLAFFDLQLFMVLTYPIDFPIECESTLAKGCPKPVAPEDLPSKSGAYK